MPTSHYDVFLSYTSQDRPDVLKVYEALKSRGLHPWLDVEVVPPGRPFRLYLEEIIHTVGAALVLVGRSGTGPWAELEMSRLLNEFVARKLPVIPTLLPGASPDLELPGFLGTFGWVDLREGLSEEGIERLVWGIRGEKPQLPESVKKKRPRRTRNLSPAPLQNLPYEWLGALFFGRSEELKTLAARLVSRGPTTPRVQKLILHGLGGVGKTRLAVEYAWRYGDRYTATMFVVAESPERLRSQLAILARPDLIDLRQAESYSQELMEGLILRWLREHPGWLMIIDDVGSPEAVRAVVDLLPRLTGGQVLITSRIEYFHWPRNLSKLPVEIIASLEAAQFLLAQTAESRLPSPDDGSLAKRLAELLDHLPLALEQAAAYIVHHRMTLADYILAWEKEEAKEQQWQEGLVAGSSRPLAFTFQHTLKQLAPADVALLRLASYLAPEPIPLALFQEGAVILAVATGQVAAEAGTAVTYRSPRDSVADLAIYSMVRWSGGDTFSVHRMVQKVMRLSLHEEQRGRWIELALRLVQRALPPDPDDIRNWSAWDPLRPHLFQVITHADRAGLGRLAVLSMNQLATLLYTRGLFAQAEPLMRRGLEISEESLGDNHPDIAVLLNNLAALLRQTHRFALAEPLLRRALAIDQAQPEYVSSPSVARDLSNLAALLRDTDRLAEAEPLLRQALAIHEQQLGSFHPYVTRDLNNLAQLLQDTERLEEAEKLMRRVLAIDESADPFHPNVARDCSNLAQLLQTTQRLKEAEELMRRALAIDQRLNPAHPNVALDSNNLAQLLQDTQRLEEAERLMREALAIDESFLGPEHPDLAFDLNNLAHLLLQDRRRDEAEPLMCRALDILEHSLGRDHPETRSVRRSLNYLHNNEANPD